MKETKHTYHIFIDYCQSLTEHLGWDMLWVLRNSDPLVFRGGQYGGIGVPNV